MDPALALGEAAEKLGVVVAAIGAGGALVLRGPGRRALAVSCALVVATAVLLGHIWDSDQFRSVSDNAAAFTALLIAIVVVTVGLGALYLRYPGLFALMAVAALPFRVPIEAAGATVNLLVPLYAVIGGGAVAYVWRAIRLRGSSGRQPESLAAREPGLLEWALAAFVVLYALQALYSRDVDTAVEHLVFFYVPFALMFRLLAELRWTPALLGGCAAVTVTLALAFSGIGFWEYSQRELLWNPKVISANQFESYFRVNSVFWDPNVYGRFLALSIVTVAAVLLWRRTPRTAAAAAVVLAVLWGGLVLTFSQSSFVSLLAGLAVLAALRWDARRTLAATAVAGALAIVCVLAFQNALRIQLGSSSGLNRATSGRVDLIEGGLDLFADRPLWGYGSGSFARAFRLERKGNQEQAVSASHTMPITVAAEQGLAGLAVYALLLAAAYALLLGVHLPRPRLLGGHAGSQDARAPPSGADHDGGPSGDVVRAPSGWSYLAARAAIVAAFTTLVVHTMMYAAFLEDPVAWLLLGIGAALAPIAWPARAMRGAPIAAAEAAPTRA